MSIATWTYDPALGVIHGTDCRVCLQYKAHVAGAKDTSDVSYRNALSERDKGHTNRFLEGFRHGRYTQRTHDNERLKEYIAQRDEARLWMLRYNDNLEDAKSEITRLQSELLSLRRAYDQSREGQGLSDKPPSAPSVTHDNINVGHTLSSDSELLTISSISDEESASFSVSDGEPMVPDTDSNASDDESRMETIPRPETPVDEVLDFLSNRQDKAFERTHNHSSAIRSWHLDVIPHTDSSENDSLPFGNEPTDSLSSRAENEDVNYITSLIGQAHDPESGQASHAITLIKSLCSRAHDTPPGLRTEAQLYLLKEWRRPKLLLFSAVSPAPINLEAYVDASGTGIGFVKGNKWEAWSLKKGWKKGGRDITWAEAVAVELGLRLLIQAGHRDRRIVLRSDSTAVVNAIKRPFKKAWNDEVLIRIRHLCHVHLIDLQLKWISTDKNPADRPSRGKHGPVEDRFLSSFDIPSHLVDVVEPLIL